MTRLVTFEWRNQPYTLDIDAPEGDPAYELLRGHLLSAVDRNGAIPGDVYHASLRGTPLLEVRIVSITEKV